MCDECKPDENDPHHTPAYGWYAEALPRYEVPDVRPTYEELTEFKASPCYKIVLHAIEKASEDELRQSDFFESLGDSTKDNVIGKLSDSIVKTIMRYHYENVADITDSYRTKEPGYEYSLFVGRESPNKDNEGVITRRVIGNIIGLLRFRFEDTVGWVRSKEGKTSGMDRDGSVVVGMSEEGIQTAAPQFVNNPDYRHEYESSASDAETFDVLWVYSKVRLSTHKKTDPVRVAWYFVLVALIRFFDTPQQQYWLEIKDWMVNEFSDIERYSCHKVNESLHVGNTLEALEKAGVIDFKGVNKSRQFTGNKIKIEKELKMILQGIEK